MTMMAKDIVWGCAGDGISARLKHCLMNYFDGSYGYGLTRIKIKSWENVTIDDLARLDRRAMLGWPFMGKKTLARFNQVIEEILRGAYADPTVSLGVKAEYIRELAIQLSLLSDEDAEKVSRDAQRMRELRQALESVSPTETPFQRSVGPRHNTMYEWSEVTL
jgi:hypothetical protein